jgi:hypothetical protein
VQVRLGTIDIDKRSDDCMDGNLCALDDVLDKGSELGMFRAAAASASSRRRWTRTTHCIVDSFDNTVYEIFW